MAWPAVAVGDRVGTQRWHGDGSDWDEVTLLQHTAIPQGAGAEAGAAHFPCQEDFLLSAQEVGKATDVLWCYGIPVRPKEGVWCDGHCSSNACWGTQSPVSGIKHGWRHLSVGQVSLSQGYTHPTTPRWARSCRGCRAGAEPPWQGQQNQENQEMGFFFGGGAGGTVSSDEVGLGWTEIILLFINLLGKWTDILKEETGLKNTRLGKLCLTQSNQGPEGFLSSTLFLPLWPFQI